MLTCMKHVGAIGEIRETTDAVQILTRAAVVAGPQLVCVHRRLTVFAEKGSRHSIAQISLNRPCGQDCLQALVAAPDTARVMVRTSTGAA